MTFVEDFVGRLLETVTGQREKGWSLVAMRKPNEKSIQGDFSFPTDFRIWRECLQGEKEDFSGDIFTYRGVQPEEIVQNLRVEKVEILKNRCVIFLDRKETFKRVITSVLESPERDGEESVRQTVFLEEIEASSENLTDFRGLLLRNVLVNLLQRSRKFQQVSQGSDADIRCLITSKSSTPVAAGVRKILPGVVLDSKTRKKSSSASWAHYLEEKVKECELVARHRYGFRGPGDPKAEKMFENLGRASLSLELLEAKPTSPVAFGETSSRGAAFILYNSARMETLLETFKARNFPETPEIDAVDFSLLSEPEEWVILLNFIAAEQWMIEKCLSELDGGRISPHLVCTFLQSLVTNFSAYYRRVQILTVRFSLDTPLVTLKQNFPLQDNRQHLLNTLHARILLLRALRKVFNRTLALLDICPVAKM